MNSRILVAILLIVSTILFAVGVTLEKSSTDAHESDAGVSRQADKRTEEGGLESLESTPVIAGVVVLFAALAVAAFVRSESIVFWLIAAVTAATAVLDLSEIVHQLGEEKPGIAGIAALAAITHALAALVSSRVALRAS